MAEQVHVVGAVDWGLNISWRTLTYGTGTIPADGDTVRFTDGTDAVTGTMNQSGIDLAFMYEGPGFSGRVGTESGPLQIDVNNSSAGIWDKGGPGTWHITPGTIWTANLRAGASTYYGGTVDIVNVFGGIHRFTDGCDLNGNPVTVKGGQVTIDYKGSDTPNVTIHGGLAYIYRATGTLTVRAGRAIVMVDRAATGATTVVVEGTGMLDWRAGNIGTLTGTSGVIDFSKIIQPITITNSTYSGARAIARNGANGNQITYTNPSSITDPPDGDRS